MAIRECKRGHLVRDDEADFCPTCRQEGKTVLLGPPSGSAPALRTPTSNSPADSAKATVGLLLIVGILGLVIGWFIVVASSEDVGDAIGLVVIGVSGVLFAIAVIANAVSLGIRMARES